MEDDNNNEMKCILCDNTTTDGFAKPCGKCKSILCIPCMMKNTRDEAFVCPLCTPAPSVAVESPRTPIGIKIIGSASVVLENDHLTFYAVKSHWEKPTQLVITGKMFSFSGIESFVNYAPLGFAGYGFVKPRVFNFGGDFGTISDGVQTFNNHPSTHMESFCAINGTMGNGIGKQPDETHFDLDLSTQTISEVKIEGSGEMTFKQLPTAESVFITISGSGDVEFECSGQLPDVHVNITGSGDVTCQKGLKCVKMHAMITGSGGISNFHATEKIKAMLTGSGYIKVSADANTNIDKKCTGSGKIKIDKPATIKKYRRT